jgi:hypothetical protein
MFDRKSKSYPPTLNQQTGQWHFYDDEGKPIDLRKPKQEPESDEEVTCCITMK